jgi:hypothetical protein
MVCHYRGNGPARGRESRGDVRQALVDQQNGEKRGSCKAKQPDGYLDFARRFHRVRDQFRARERRCAYVTTKSQRSRRSAPSGV